MKYRTLGRTGIQVTELCLGTSNFGAVTPLEEAREIFATFVDSGGNFIDTSVNYAGGKSEELVGELLGTQRDEFVLATKYTAPMRKGDPNARGNHAKCLRQALETSLKRLKTDHIDLYWVHAWEEATPLETLVEVLDDAVRSGKVLHVGICNTPAWAVAVATTLADATRRTRFAAIQVEYNLVERGVERELGPMSEHLGLSVLAWGPLAGGLLTGKYLKGQEGHREETTRLRPDDYRMTDRNREIAGEVVQVANMLGCSPAAVALAWLRDRPARPIPVVGARTKEQLTDSLQCLKLELEHETKERLNIVSKEVLGYPHDYLARIRASGPPEHARVPAEATR